MIIGNDLNIEIKGKAFISDQQIVLNTSINLRNALVKYIEYAAKYSCGKCTPCRNGLPVLVEYLASDVSVSKIVELARLIKETSKCGLGQNAASPVILASSYLSSYNSSDAMTYEFILTSPCKEGCPSKVEIPSQISETINNNLEKSLEVVYQKYLLAASCGRICPHPCENYCSRNHVDNAVNIRGLKRFVADSCDVKMPTVLSNNKRIAVIGGGPSGLTAAYHLLLKGYKIDIYDDALGGMLTRGIPEYRLPRDVLREDILRIEKLGAKFINKRIGVDFKFSDLSYDAIFIAIGASKGKKLGIEGESLDLTNYSLGIDLLQKINKGEKIPGKKIGVVGGGNVALDCVRSLTRQGKEVHLIYRRKEENMPADRHEILDAKDEGVIFHFLKKPSKVGVLKNKVTCLDAVEMEEVAGRLQETKKEWKIDLDYLVAAIGQESDALGIPDLKPINNLTLETNIKGVFAGGDFVLGPATLVQAMAQGELAATNIDRYINNLPITDDYFKELVNKLEKERNVVSKYINKKSRKDLTKIDINQRNDFREVESSLTKDEALVEASRCLGCYHLYMMVS